MPVNLLVVVPTVVAVSSTVDNRTILPEHIVDGKLDTAWNSRTNELVGAWVAVRLPADVHVDEIKLTAGFTKVDKKLGDLFTMNPRIKRVRIWHDGKQLAERDLDVESRALQALPIDGAGGDYKIEVVDFVPGSKKTWREMPISELEVWGTPAAATKPAKVSPVVRVGSLDKQPLTQADCVKAVGATDKVVGFSALDLAGEVSVCRVDTLAAGADETAVAVAVVKRGARPVVIGGPPPLAVYKKQGVLPAYGEGGAHNEDRDITLTAVQLTADELALQVDDREVTWDPINSDEKRTTILYRVSGGAVNPVLTFESHDGASDGVGTSDRCELVQPDLGPKLPARLDVRCIKTSNEPYPGKTTTTKERTVRYRWNGSSYVK